MTRKITRKSATDVEPGLDISSLIDVSFLLLIYFLVTTTLSKKEVDVGLTLPTPESTDLRPPPLRPLALALEEDGMVVVNPEQSAEELGKADEEFRNMALYERLNDYKETADRAGQTPRVLLRAANGADHQKLVSVFNEISSAEISDVTLDGFVGYD